jgi:hypothetical protein
VVWRGCMNLTEHTCCTAPCALHTTAYCLLDHIESHLCVIMAAYAGAARWFQALISAPEPAGAAAGQPHVLTLDDDTCCPDMPEHGPCADPAQPGVMEGPPSAFYVRRCWMELQGVLMALAGAGGHAGGHAVSLPGSVASASGGAGPSGTTTAHAGSAIAQPAPAAHARTRNCKALSTCGVCERQHARSHHPFDACLHTHIYLGSVHQMVSNAQDRQRCALFYLARVHHARSHGHARCGQVVLSVVVHPPAVPAAQPTGHPVPTS